MLNESNFDSYLSSLIDDAITGVIQREEIPALIIRAEEYSVATVDLVLDEIDAIREKSIVDYKFAADCDYDTYYNGELVS